MNQSSTEMGKKNSSSLSFNDAPERVSMSLRPREEGGKSIDRVLQEEKKKKRCALSRDADTAKKNEDYFYLKLLQTSSGNSEKGTGSEQRHVPGNTGKGQGRQVAPLSPVGGILRTL